MLSDVDLLASKEDFFDMLMNFLTELVSSNIGVVSIFRKEEEVYRYQINISAQELDI
jgi:hypothetical protein